MKTFETKRIKPAAYNPPNRIAGTTSLLKSVKEHGIIVPLIIDKEGNLIDGHRRLHVAKFLKIKTVPVIVLTNTLTKDVAYDVINTNSKKISNHDILFIYLNGGHVPKIALKYIKEMEELIGSSGLKKLAEKSTTYTIITYGKLIQKYCREAENKAFLAKAIFWLSDHKMIYAVRRAMEARVSHEVILKAVKNNKPLKVTYE
jgi:hypothetical protein